VASHSAHCAPFFTASENSLRHAHRFQIARHGLHGRAAATPYLSLSQYLQPRATARALILHEFSHSRHLHCSARCSQREPCPQARLRAQKPRSKRARLFTLSTGAPQSHAAGHACVIQPVPFMHSPQRRTACRLAASLLFSALRFMQCCINRAKRGRYPSLYISLSPLSELRIFRLRCVPVITSFSQLYMPFKACNWHCIAYR